MNPLQSIGAGGGSFVVKCKKMKFATMNGKI